MDQAESHTSSSSPSGATTLDEAFQALWDRSRRAGEMILSLREERRALAAQIDQLRDEVRTLQGEIQKKDKQLRENANEPKPVASPFNGDHQVLAARLKELLAKIDAYL